MPTMSAPAIRAWRRSTAAVAVLAALLLGGCVAYGDDAHPIEGEGNPGIGESDGIIRDADGNPIEGAEFADDGSLVIRDADGNLIDAADGSDAAAQPPAGSDTLQVGTMKGFITIDASALGEGVTWRGTRISANCIAGDTDFPEPGSTDLAQSLAFRTGGSCLGARSWATWKLTATFPDGRTASTTVEIQYNVEAKFICWGDGALSCPVVEWRGSGWEVWMTPKLDPLPTRPDSVYCAEEGKICVNSGGSAVQVSYGRDDKWTTKTLAAGASIECSNEGFGSDPIFSRMKLCFLGLS